MNMAGDSQHLLSNSSDALFENEYEKEQFLQQDIGISTAEALDESMPIQDTPDESVPLPPDKKYHLFISYSSEDRDDAIKICDHMEQRFHMKCMNFERDFVPGKHIDDNIADEMRSSVKVLIILSPNYIKSHWCVQEAREACELSFTDLSNLNVIPLMLRPLDDKLPPFLKSLVYIDAQRELDVPAKIHEAFVHSGSIDPLFRSGEMALNANNGAFLCQKFASKANFWEHGFAYRFPPLEEHEKEKFASFDLDPIECAKHYDFLIKDLNDGVLIRKYPLFVSKWRFLLVCVMFLTTTCFFAGLGFIALSTGGNLGFTVFVIITIVGVVVVILICPCSLCCLYICRRSLSSSIHPVLLRLNVEFYTTSKCLIFFDNSSVSKPSLNIFKYDASECRKYICLLLEKTRPALSEEEIKKTTDGLFNEKLRDLQLTNGLINWTSLPESASKRHNTRNFRACLCEMVEDILNSERRDIHRGIIEV
ncbi:uncharacterized protein LOC125674819 isoform X2 [Ostrea edulis]|uniref:uncharacterized protein LOC125674819 isoform X2 n=1 Tax=Ostrea edulis TaxID=37623 RepID=UPI0024AF5758|nr:uncharacterized protein LOC125674819 isoform X2 [Ostrea edulis]